jgi:hypothetical protein
MVVTVLALAVALSRPSAARMLAAWLACVFLWLAIPLVPRGWTGVLQPWTAPGKVYAWAAQRVDRTGGVTAFLDDYDHVQRAQPVHARSHPPGATLASYWTQRIDPPVRKTNPLRLAFLSSFALPIVFAIGLELADRRRALAAAALFGTMPAAAVYSTYSHDPLFAVFLLLHLWASLRIARGSTGAGMLLVSGAALFAASMMTYAAAFTAAAAGCLAYAFGTPGAIRSRRWWRAVTVPPIVAVALHLVLAVTTGFDYPASFLEAHRFHSAYYPFAGPADWTYALVGGQLEFLWGVGPVAGGIAVATLLGRAAPDPVLRFSLAVLVPYAVALLAGPNPLKLETARCWYWLAAVPAVLTGGRLLDAGGDKPVLFVAASSIGIALVSILFLDFGV